MIPVTVAGVDCYLLHYTADWSEKFTATFSVLAEGQRGLTGKEVRQPLSETLRVASLKYQILLHREDSAQFRVGLQRLKDKPVLVPFWPGAQSFVDGEGVFVYADPFSGSYYQEAGGPALYVQATGSTLFFGGGLWLFTEPDGSALAVVESGAEPPFTPSPDCIRVPLLMGFFASDPEPVALTDELLRATVEFRESSKSAYALAVIANTDIPGPTIEGRTPPVFPQRITFDEVQAGGAGVAIEREDVGFLRELAAAYYEQGAERLATFKFLTGSWGETARLLRFFQDRAGTVRPFWLPYMLADGRTAAPVDAADTTITVEDAEAVGDNVHLALISPTKFAPVKVASIAGDVLTLAAAVGEDFDTDEATLCSLVLARFNSAQLTISWTTDAVAEASIRFVECSAEYDTTGDTYGTDIGALAVKAFLYRFTLAYPTPIVWRFTSFESAITYGGAEYSPRPMDHGEMVEDITPDENTIELKSRVFTENPLKLFLPFQLEKPLQLEIFEGEVAAGALVNASTLFVGEVNDAEFDGPFIKAEATNVFARLSQKVPAPLIQQGCNTSLFSAKCGISKAAWKFQGTVTGYNPAGPVVVSVGSLTRVGVGAVSSGDSHYFALGTMEVGGSAFAVRTIFDTTTITGGAFLMTLDYPLATALVPGDVIDIYPGCDGLAGTCDLKFDNYLNFRAFPFVPVGNPTLATVKKSTGGGKK